MPNGPEATAEQIDDLSTLLMDHPFAADQLLLHTVDHSVTTGAAQSQARAVAAALRQAGRASRTGGRRPAPQRARCRHRHGGDLVGGAVFVPVNPRLPEAEIEGVLGPDRSGRHHRARGHPGPARSPHLCARHRLHSVDLGHHRPAQAHPPHPSRLRRAAGPGAHALAFGERAIDPGAVTQPHPGFAGPERRHLQRLVRPPGRRRPGDHEPLRDRRSSPNWCAGSRSAPPSYLRPPSPCSTTIPR